MAGKLFREVLSNGQYLGLEFLKVEAFTIEAITSILSFVKYHDNNFLGVKL